MSDVYLAFLILFCIAALGWGLEKMSRVYQFPFFMGGIFIAFLVPQAIALYVTSRLPSKAALERVLLMSVLCLAMCLMSYALPSSPKLIRSLNFSVNPKRLFHGGLFLASLGFVFSFLALNTEITLNSRGQLTGLRTIYSTFAYLSIPGLAILLLLALKRPTIVNISAALFAAFIPLYRIVVFGRRETIAAFLLAIGLALFFQKRVTPPRTLAIAAIVFALLVIPLIGQYRRVSASGNWNLLWDLDPIGNLQNMVESAKDLELEYAALQMDATVKSGQHGYGLGYWNILAFRFIPAQLLGRGFKEALMLQTKDYSLKTLYDYVPNPGLVPTGIADSFIEFDYFGCLVFLILGYVLKNLWISAAQYNSVLSQILYISFLPGSMKAVTHGTGTCLADFVFYAIFIFAVVLYARRRIPRPALHYTM
jgi:hypothetical protein